MHVNFYTARGFWIGLLAVALLSVVSAQNQTPALPTPHAANDSVDSVAAAARRNKANKVAHAKRMVTDDDLQPSLGPLPRLKTNEAENGEEVIAAIASYKQTHSSEQTEAAIRRWYDEYDRELEEAIKHNQEIKALRRTNMIHAYELCENPQDYEQCQARRMAEIDGERHDQTEIMRNTDRITLLQHSLMNIRNRLPQMGLRYDWFKVRTTNNIDRF